MGRGRCQHRKLGKPWPEGLRQADARSSPCQRKGPGQRLADRVADSHLGWRASYLALQSRLELRSEPIHGPLLLLILVLIVMGPI